MDIRPSDLIKLKKEIERIRKHEESRRGKESASETGMAQSADVIPKPARRPAINVGFGLSHTTASLVSSAKPLKGGLHKLVSPPEPSKESLEAIPEHVVTLLRVIREVPKFAKWLFALEKKPKTYRNQQLSKMSFAFRVEDADSPIAASFDRLHETALFTAFCQALHDETDLAT
jgi:hypothetical protein